MNTTRTKKSCHMQAELDAFVERLPASVEINEAVRLALRDLPIDDTYRDRAVAKQLAQDLRRAFTKPGPGGLPARMSVPDERGRRAYTQIELFDREQFRVAWVEADHRAQRAAEVKSALEREYAKRFVGESLARQMELAFAEAGGGVQT